MARRVAQGGRREVGHGFRVRVRVRVRVVRDRAAWAWVREAFDDGWVGVPREDPLRVRPWCARAFLHLTIAIRAWVRRMCACAHARVRRVKCQEEARLHVGSVRRPRTRLLLRLQQRTLTRDWRERGRALVRGLGRLVRRLRLRLRVRPGLRRCPGEPLPQLRAGRAGRRRRRVGARVRRQMQLAWPGLGLGLGLGLGFGFGLGLGLAPDAARRLAGRRRWWRGAQPPPG